MRLFIAINFEESVKDAVQDIIEDIKRYSKQGKFVNNEYMHLTLEFLGEIPPEKVNMIREAMDQLTEERFILELSKIGYFKRREGNIYWIGFNESTSLYNIQKELHNLLLEKGFELENREYKPHLTIGRKVLMNKDFNQDLFLNSLKEITIPVYKIDLMKSEHINGTLKHTVIYSKPL